MGIETTVVVEESTEPPICGLTNATRNDSPGLKSQDLSKSTTTTATPALSSDAPKVSTNEKITIQPATSDADAQQNRGPVATEPHTVPVSQLEEHLETSLQHGLSSDEATRRLGQDGPNKVEGAKGLSLWKILVRQVSNALTAVLFIVMALSFAIGDYIEGGVIAAVILLNIVVGYVVAFLVNACATQPPKKWFRTTGVRCMLSLVKPRETNIAASVSSKITVLNRLFSLYSHCPLRHARSSALDRSIRSRLRTSSEATSLCSTSVTSSRLISVFAMD